MEDTRMSGWPEPSRAWEVVAVGHGFDTIKTRMQCSLSGTYRGAFDALNKTIKNEGIFALYKGATPPAVGWTAIDSVLLGSLHNYRLFLIRNGMTEMSPSGLPRLSLFAHGVAGLFAGWTSALVATPVELLKGIDNFYATVKLQLQSQKAVSDRQFKSTIDCARQIIRVQGVTGLWSGFTGLFYLFDVGILIIDGHMPQGINAWLFEIGRDPLRGTANFLSGGLGSFVFWAMAIPFDNIKNRMMAYPYPQPYPQSKTASLAVLKRPSFFRVARNILVHEGAAGFIRGLGPCYLRAFPVNASALFVYEGTMRILGAEQVFISLDHRHDLQ
ncbi:hypothetical protein CVT25_014023 [Psilocybe cyanescens]|uniref:Mitochondrial carrier protein n=1 Tax=Psilocybe cyanescens TaxID=93625 RepID=A0A409XPR3_PSICY|nr:hypothetical protein CVT25_014023 [Psilocybe cyanescens]